ncbi:hypothetical protein ABIQ69_02705 [Agromyces sp. G08B096]|uniref:Uncharacterized protein n=1 Tax=Agromyces sp. G08B096 TaxID=3156399 RepID=A0AAU7WA35_9MICO
MRATFRLFPWDVEGDLDAARALADDGIDRVALAATYHGARTITPRHPAHRIVDVPHSASYLRGASPLPAGDFSFDRARAELEAADIEVGVWAVVGHLDAALPSLPRVRNAFGDRLDHAPCLSHEAVRAALREIVAAAAVAARGGTLHLEALGWQGLGHGSLHEKLHGADLADGAAELLALCACEACAERAGMSQAQAVGAVRAALARASDPSRADADADADALDALRRARAETAERFAVDALEVAFGAGVRTVGIAAAELPLQTGADASGLDVLVDCWGDVARGRGNLARAGGGTAYVDALTGDPDGFAAAWADLVAHGATGLHVYHAGLASTERRRAAARAAAAITSPDADAERGEMRST